MIIPEIEMPGHSAAALASYPWLGCTGGPYEVWTKWGISEDIYCAGKETTFEFLENVLAEVIALFPSNLIQKAVGKNVLSVNNAFVKTD